MIVAMKILALNSKLYNIFKVSVREDLHTTISLTLHLFLILSFNQHRKAKKTPELSPLVSLMAMMDLEVYMIT
jgi:hypothetical protein